MGSVNFVLSMFYRVSTAVISPALVRDLGVTSSQLSDLSAVFFYAFALSQLPIGVSLDRRGARITMAILAVFAVGGAVVFAVGQTPNQLMLGRALLGVGMSGNLMVVLALLAAWFPVDRFALLSGTTVSIGVAGNLLAATPLTMMSIWIGWRASFLVFAAVNAAVVLAFLAVARDHPPGHFRAARRPKPIVAGLKQLTTMYGYWAISFSNFVRYGYFAALQSLWLAPYLVYGLKLGEVTASNAILMTGLGYMVGLPVTGAISDRVLRSRKSVALVTMICFCLLTFSMVWHTSSTSLWIVMVTMFGMGFTAAPGQILYAHMKELLPQSMIAQAMTAVNLFTVLGAGVMTHIPALLVKGEPSSLTGARDFDAIWYLGTLSLAIASIAYSFVPDSRVFKSGE